MLIRDIESKDASKFVDLLLTIDKESNFTLFYENERNTDKKNIELKISNMKKNGSNILIAEYEDKMIGYLSCNRGISLKTKHVINIAIGVISEYQNRGIGADLINEMFKWCSKNDVSRIELTTITNNEKAINLYKKMGFEIEGLRKNSIF